MRTRDSILKDLGLSDEYNAHGGIPLDTKEIILVEILLDLRDIIQSAKFHLVKLIQDTKGRV